MTDVGHIMLHMDETQQFVIPAWTLGWRLQRALDFAGIKAGDMAESLEVTRGTVSRWMHDGGAPPRKVYLRQWAALCGVPYEWLAEGDEAPNTDGYMSDNALPSSIMESFGCAA